MKQTEEFWKNGKKAESEVFEARSLLAQAELSEVKAAGTYQLAVLDLTQILELDSPENFTIAPVEGDTMAVTLEQPDFPPGTKHQAGNRSREDTSPKRR